MPAPCPKSSVTTSSESLGTVNPVRCSRPSPEISGSEESCLTNWMRQADVEDGNRPGRTREESAELRRRNRLLEQENVVLRRAAAYLSQANLPGNGSTRSGVGYAAEGTPVAVSLRILKHARQP